MEQVILTPCGGRGAVKILLPGFPSTDRLAFKRAVKSFVMFRSLKSDVKYSKVLGGTGSPGIKPSAPSASSGGVFNCCLGF